MKFFKNIITILAAAVAWSCSPDGQVDNIDGDNHKELYGPSGQYDVLEALPTAAKVILTQEDQVVLDDLNKATFAANLLAESMLGQDPTNESGNYAMSPMSAAICMALVSNSIDDPWGSQAAAAVGLGSSEKAKVFFLKMMQYLPAPDTGVNICIANSIWYTSKYSITDAFKSFMQGEMRVPVTPVNFIADDYAAIINNWGEENTHGLIKNCCPPLTPDQVIAVWANAFHFMGNWKEPFCKEATQSIEFRGRNATILATTMRRVLDASYSSLDGCEMVRLPFEKNYTLDIVKCKEGMLTADLYATLIENSRKESTYIDFYLPKFSIDTQASFNDLYPGFVKALDYATFNKMGFTGVTNNSIKTMQTTTFEIDENGARGASVTVIGSETSGYPRTPKVVKYDEPFTFVIRNNEIGAVVFIGRVNNL